MTIIDRIRRFWADLSLSNPKAWDRSLWNLIGSQSLSGENVTEQTALTYSAVWNADELISGTIAALPLNLMQRKGDTNRMATDRKLFRVMHSQWNPYMTAKRGRQTQLSHMLLWGNGYAEIVRDGYGEVSQLWPITPSRCRPILLEDYRSSENPLGLCYEIRLDRTAPIILPREKVLHIMGPSFDGFVGYSRIAMARKSIGLGMAMETFGSNFFGKGTNPSMVVSHPGHLKDPTALRTALSEAYAGLGNSHRLMLLEENMHVEKYGIPPNDCQFLESRQFSITEIARWFNLPPHKLKDLTRSSFNNIESEDASFIRDRLVPDIVDLEQSYEMQLLTEGDRAMYGRGELYFKHNLKGLLRADTAARTAFYTAMLDRGVFCIDDVLELEDMDKLANGLGQKRLVQQNMTTLENAGKPPTTAAPEPSKEPTPMIPKKKGETALLEVMRR